MGVFIFGIAHAGPLYEFLLSADTGQVVIYRPAGLYLYLLRRYTWDVSPIDSS